MYVLGKSFVLPLHSASLAMAVVYILVNNFFFLSGHREFFPEFFFGGGIFFLIPPNSLSFSVFEFFYALPPLGTGEGVDNQSICFCSLIYKSNPDQVAKLRWFVIPSEAKACLLTPDTVKPVLAPFTPLTFSLSTTSTVPGRTLCTVPGTMYCAVPGRKLCTVPCTVLYQVQVGYLNPIG